jgi:putative transposase
MIEAWRRHYNDVRPHSSLAYMTPTEYAAKTLSTNTTTTTTTRAQIDEARFH